MDYKKTILELENIYGEFNDIDYEIEQLLNYLRLKFVRHSLSNEDSDITHALDCIHNSSVFVKGFKNEREIEVRIEQLIKKGSVDYTNGL